MNVPPFLTILEGANYNNETLGHPHFERAIDETLEAIRTFDGTGVIQVLGPTGVGKSHLGREIESRLIRQHISDNPSDIQQVPIPRFTVRLLNNQGFNWALFYEDYINAMKHPKPQFSGLKDARKKIKEAHLSRKPIAVLVDEAHNIFAGCSTEAGVHAQSEVLKSLCEDAGAKLVFIGTYDQAAWINCNGQTARRNRPIHFPRYQNSQSERKLFRGILELIDEEHSAIISEPLTKHEDYLYEGTIGLVGKLRVWLVRALNNALSAGESTISFEALQATRYQTKALLTILRECHAGERFIQESEQDRQDLREMLALDSQAPSIRTGFAKSAVQQMPRARARIKKLPRRDPVGIHQ